MKHVEVTENGKVIWSLDAPQVIIYQTRALTPIYREGENKPYTIAPSRIAQTAIYCEECTEAIEGETTFDKPLQVIGAQTVKTIA